MEAVELKIILKNSKPLYWRRVLVPLGITFSQLAYILDIVMEEQMSEHFFFEFYNEGIRLIENPEFFPNHYRYTKYAANETYVREYVENAKWFTFESFVGLNKAYRVEIKSVGILELDTPYCIKGWFIDENHFNEINRELKEKCTYVLTDPVQPLFKEIKGFIYATKNDKNKVMRTRQDIQKETPKILKSLKNNTTTKSESIKKMNLKDVLSDFDEEAIDEMILERKLDSSNRTYQEKILQLTKYMLQPKVMLANFTVLSDHEIQAFEDLYNKKEVNEDYLSRLTDLSYVAYKEDGQYEIPEDVWKIYQTLHLEYYEEKRRIMNYILRCVETGIYLYMCYPIDHLLELVHLKYSVSMNELKEFLKDIPSEVMDLHIGDWVYLTMMDTNNGRQDLLDIQGNQPYYMPTYDEIIAYTENYSWNIEASKKLYDYLIQMGMYKNRVKECIVYVQNCIRISLSFEEMIDYIESEMDGRTLSAIQMEKLNKILVEIKNNTRMFIYRGFTLNEIKKRHQLPKKIKVGRNDPCPCGSGKKYKKCCGR